MAIFNPEPQDIPIPNYHGLSNPNMAGDTSLGVALHGAGNVIEGAVKGAHTVVESLIDQAAEQGVDKLRNATTGVFENTLGIPQEERQGTPTQQVAALGQPAAPQAPAPNSQGAPDLIPGSVANIVPADLQAATDRPVQAAIAGTKSGAKGALGLYYDMNLNLLAKDLRTQYPGFRDYVDKKISQLSGGEWNANSYQKRLQDLIAEAIGNNKSQQDHAFAILEKPEMQDNPALPKLINDVRTGNTGGMDPRSYVMLHSSSWLGLKEKNRQEAADRERVKGDRDELIAQSKTGIITMGDRMINNRMISLFGHDLTFDQTEQLIAGITDNKIGASTMQLEQLRSALHLFRDSLFNDMHKEAHDAKGTSQSIAGVIGETAVSEAINGRLAGIDSIIKQVGSGEFGLVGRTARMSTALTNDDSINLKTHAQIDVQRWARAVAVLNKDGGQNAVNAVVKDAMANNIPNKLKSVTEGQKMEIAAGNVSRNLTDSIIQLKQAMVGQGDTPADKRDRAAYDTLTNVVKAIPSVPPNIVENIVKGSYGPGNEKLLDQFNGTSVGPDGKTRDSQRTLFDKMTNINTTDAIWKLRGNPEAPTAWPTYKGWAEVNHQKLFGRDVKGLDALAGPGKSVGLAVSYDSDLMRFDLHVTPEYKGPASAVSAMRDKINNINAGLVNMINIANKEGTEPNSYVLNIMNAEGLTPGNFGISGKMATALVKSMPPPPEKEGEPSAGRKVLDYFKTLPTRPYFEPQKGQDSGEKPINENPNFPKLYKRSEGDLSGGTATSSNLTEGVTDLSARRRTRVASRGNTDASGNSLSNAPVDTGVIDRARFKAELDKNPKLREKILAISVGENLHPKANLAVMETMMNRADVRGTSLAQAARLYGQESGGYYAGYSPKNLRNPAYRKLAEDNLKAALNGSNVSDFATDNASGGLAERNVRLNRFEKRAAFGNNRDIETFFAPQKYGRAQYEQWLKRVKTRPGNSDLVASAE